jgi:hypothetical protein
MLTDNENQSVGSVPSVLTAMNSINGKCFFVLRKTNEIQMMDNVLGCWQLRKCALG